MLFVAGIPIGNPEDISLRVIRLLKECDFVIGEELKQVSKFLRGLEIQAKEILLLNEHSLPTDIKELGKLCRDKNVVLVSDCGTPGFCDPGPELVDWCYKNNVEVQSLPGPSSLATFMSVCGVRAQKFHFEGFLPAKTELRIQRLNQLKKVRFPLIIMDTPYRLVKTLEQIAQVLPERDCVLGLELSKESEKILRGKAKTILKMLKVKKAEFLLLLQ